jgi:O-succinylbenzoate synthase
MGKHAEQQSAARQFYADAPRPKTAREVCEEADEMRAVLIDEWADKLVGGGDVPRVYAQRCAVVVVAELRGREGRGVATVVDGPGADDAGASRPELLRGLREIGARIYEAKKRGMEAGALVLATGSVHGDFQSARELAMRQGVSHELAANAVEAWQETLGLPRTSGQKSEEARESYRNTNGKQRAAA